MAPASDWPAIGGGFDATTIMPGDRRTPGDDHRLATRHDLADRPERLERPEHVEGALPASLESLRKTVGDLKYEVEQMVEA